MQVQLSSFAVRLHKLSALTRNIFQVLLELKWNKFVMGVF